MGGIINGLTSLFGSKAQTKSNNQGFNAIKGTEGQYANNGTTADNTLGSTGAATYTGANNVLNGALGIGGGGSAASDDAFKDYQNSTGYKSQLESGSNAITNNAAASGLLNSGDTLKALDTFGQNLGATSYQTYLNNLQTQQASGQQATTNVAGNGLQADSTLGNVGTSAGTANAKNAAEGVGAVGSLATTAASLAGWL